MCAQGKKDGDDHGQQKISSFFSSKPAKPQKASLFSEYGADPSPQSMVLLAQNTSTELHVIQLSALYDCAHKCDGGTARR